MASEPSDPRSATSRQIAFDAPNCKHYQPLDKERRTIRVFDLEGEAACTLRHVSLNDKSDYHALSYYWGPPTGTGSLLIKHLGVIEIQVIHVHKTVSMFIKELHRRYGRITVWLDVVAMMGDIYRRALGVYVWMGSWDPDIDYLCSCCKRQAQGESYEFGQFASSVRQLSELSYFTRVWTIQECVLNRRLVLIGVDMSLTWQDLERALAASGQATSMTVINMGEPAYVPTHKRTMDHIRSLRHHQGHRAPLLPILFNFAQQECSDYRDKVFGYLALAGDTTNFPVDYSVSPFSLIVLALSRHNISCFDEWASCENIHKRGELYDPDQHWTEFGRCYPTRPSVLRPVNPELNEGIVHTGICLSGILQWRGILSEVDVRDVESDWLVMPVSPCHLLPHSFPDQYGDCDILMDGDFARSMSAGKSARGREKNSMEVALILAHYPASERRRRNKSSQCGS